MSEYTSEKVVSALLTDEARCEAYRVGGSGGFHDPIANFVHYHRTVGREALVEKVGRQIHDYACGCEHNPWPLNANYREMAEAVVTALVGAAPTEAKR